MEASDAIAAAFWIRWPVPRASPSVPRTSDQSWEAAAAGSQSAGKEVKARPLRLALQVVVQVPGVCFQFHSGPLSSREGHYEVVKDHLLSNLYQKRHPLSTLSAFKSRFHVLFNLRCY